ncbi:MAG: NAD-dependent isocitrate dehydrogenase, partial [Acinetobacter johnsonii]|nr:NAD-dependent isocitrate dehydrogenase [Acinetobacter johnsonii]
MTRVVVIPGDGIGPSITESTIQIIEATGVPIQWVEAQAGLGAFQSVGDPLPAATVELIRDVK